MVLYHIEKNNGVGWVPESVREDGAHKLAAFTEWFKSLDVCRGYAIRQHQKHGGAGLCGKTLFRVTDHIGNVHWTAPQ
jgi:hypothetical protein